MSLAQHAQQFLEHLRGERRLSPNTLQAYAQEFAVLQSLVNRTTHAQSAAEHGANALSDAVVSESLIRQHIAQQMRAGMAPRSLARRLSAWRALYRWLGKQGLATSNPAQLIKAPKAAKRLPKALSVDDTKQWLEQASIVDGDAALQRRIALRDQAMIELLYSSGLRLSELVSLDCRYHDRLSASWFDVSQAQATVLGKGGKTRSVPVGNKALEAIARWLEVRPQVCVAEQLDSRALFVACSGPALGKRISARTVQQRVQVRNALAGTHGMAVKVHPHALRHSFASHVLQSSGDLRAVQELLGHANVTTTQVYTSLDFQRLAAVYDQAHPRAKRVANKKAIGEPSA